MATILHLPRPVLVRDQQPDPDYFETHATLEREELKAFMKANSKLGDSPTLANVKRRPFAGELVPFSSPDDPEVIFQIKRCGVSENIQRQNLSSTVRYVEPTE